MPHAHGTQARPRSPLRVAGAPVRTRATALGFAHHRVEPTFGDRDTVGRRLVGGHLNLVAASPLGGVKRAVGTAKLMAPWNFDSPRTAVASAVIPNVNSSRE